MHEIKKYVKKPVVIEAMQFNGLDFETATEALNWVKPREGAESPTQHTYIPSSNDELSHLDVEIFTLTIPTLEGDMTTEHGDYIIRGIQGEFYPCKPDIFEATYADVADVS